MKTSVKVYQEASWRNSSSPFLSCEVLFSPSFSSLVFFSSFCLVVFLSLCSVFFLELEGLGFSWAFFGVVFLVASTLSFLFLGCELSTCSSDASRAR